MISDQKMSKKRREFGHYKKRKTLILEDKEKLPKDVIRKFFRPMFRSCLWIQRKLNGFSVEVLNDIKIPQGRPIIFAVTHIGKWDFEIVNEQIRAQSFVIAADFMHMHGTVSGFFMNLSGVIYVDEEDRKGYSMREQIVNRYISKRLRGRGVEVSKTLFYFI